MHWRVILLLAAGLASPASTQIGLPPIGQTVGAVTGTLGSTVNNVTGLGQRQPLRSVKQLAQDRVARLTAFVRAHSHSVGFDDTGQPARKDVLLLLDPDARSIDAARRLGFAASVDSLGNLGLSAAKLALPQDMTLKEALAILRKALPDKEITADHLHFVSGAAGKGGSDRALPALPLLSTPVGIIDGGVAGGMETVKAKGFAKGGPVPSDHGTAVASLLRHAGVTRLYGADVYGRDPAGGNALAIVRALDWLAAEKVPIVSISLVGPHNPLLARAVAAASRRGIVIVAAVGNDGPAAPPAFPASYSGVLAVTGVDGRNRVLIEAGRALHLDYAAPAADMRVLDRNGRARAVRGTSFAVPLVAARTAAAYERRPTGHGVRTILDAEARDLGKEGPDPVFGRGLLCGECRRR